MATLNDKLSSTAKPEAGYAAAGHKPRVALLENAVVVDTTLAKLSNTT